MSKFKTIKDFLHSLFFRLVLLFILIGIIPGVILRAGVLNSYEQRAVSIKTSEILSQAKILANQVVSNDYLNNTESMIINAELEQLSKISFLGRSQCGSVETNLTSIYEDAGSILVLGQWVKDPVLL